MSNAVWRAICYSLGPGFVISRGVWMPLIFNCLFYGLTSAGVGLAWEYLKAGRVRQN